MVLVLVARHARRAAEIAQHFFVDVDAEQEGNGSLKEERGVLKVQLTHATGLKSMDSNGFSDPYFKFVLNHESKKSSVVYKTLNPQWGDDQVFQFNPTTLHTVLKTPLQVVGWDFDKFSLNDPLGRAELDLRSLMPQLATGVPVPCSVQLRDGQLTPGECFFVVSWAATNASVPSTAGPAIIVAPPVGVQSVAEEDEEEDDDFYERGYRRLTTSVSFALPGAPSAAEPTAASLGSKDDQAAVDATSDTASETSASHKIDIVDRRAKFMAVSANKLRAFVHEHAKTDDGAEVTRNNANATMLTSQQAALKMRCETSGAGCMLSHTLAIERGLALTGAAPCTRRSQIFRFPNDFPTPPLPPPSRPLCTLSRMRSPRTDAIYWVHYNGSLVVGGTYTTKEVRYSLKQTAEKGGEAMSFAEASKTFVLSTSDTNPVSLVFRNRETLFFDGIDSVSNYKRRDLALACGVAQMVLEPMNGGVLEYGTFDRLRYMTNDGPATANWEEPPRSPALPLQEMSKAFEMAGASYYMFWQLHGDHFEIVAEYVTATRKEALRKARGDDQTFCSVSRSMKLLASGNGPVATTARTGKKMVVDERTIHTMRRAALAQQFGIARIHFIPCEDGVLEYGTPVGTALAGPLLSATMKMRCELTQAAYAIYWQEDASQASAVAHYVTPAHRAADAARGHAKTYAEESCNITLTFPVDESGISDGPVATCIRTAEPVFIEDAPSFILLRRRELARAHGITAICFVPVAGGGTRAEHSARRASHTTHVVRRASHTALLARRTQRSSRASHTALVARRTQRSSRTPWAARM